MKRIVTYTLIAIALVAGTFFAFQGIKKEKKGHVESGLAESAVPVTVSAVVQHEFQDELHAVGTLKARVTGLISPKVPGNWRPSWLVLETVLKQARSSSSLTG